MRATVSALRARLSRGLELPELLSSPLSRLKKLAVLFLTGINVRDLSHLS